VVAVASDVGRREDVRAAVETCLPLDLIHRSRCARTTSSASEQPGTSAASRRRMQMYARNHLEMSGEELSTVPDAIAVGTVVRPNLAALAPAHVTVDYPSPISRGATIFDGNPAVRQQ
jgi:inosine-uridine nucleoside N-ribohydrolase